MGSKVGQQITSWVYVDGGAAATVPYSVYDENGDIFAVGAMTHKGGARFYADWTPDAIGIWTILCECSSPSFSAILTYHVGMGQEADIIADLVTIDGYVSGIKGAGWTTETLKAIFDAIPGGGGGGIFGWKTYADADFVCVAPVQNVYVKLFEIVDGARLVNLELKQLNDEEDMEQIDLKLILDGWTIIGEDHDFAWDTIYNAVIIKNDVDSFFVSLGASPQELMMNVYDAEAPSRVIMAPLECHVIEFWADQNSALGTNPLICYKRVYQKLEVV